MRLGLFCRRGLAVISVVALVVAPVLPELIAGKPPGGGGGGGSTVWTWVIVDSDSTDTLKLLASDGVTAQTIATGRGKSTRDAPAWSSDGQWIAYFRRDLNGPGSLLYVVHPDGTGMQVVYQFDPTAGNRPKHDNGMQWVPGEVDRILYAGVDDKLYVVSFATADHSPKPLLSISGPAVMSSSGATLSPDLDLDISGYQGALAYVGPWYTDVAGLLIVAPVADGDGASGLVVHDASKVVASSLTDIVELPAWSHDGLAIAFLYNNPGFGNSLAALRVVVTPEDITLLEEDVRTLYDSGAVTEYGPYHELYHRPEWSPDDGTIAFIAQAGGEPDGTKAWDLFTVQSDGTAAGMNVTKGTRRPTFVDWKPAAMPTGK